MTYPLKCPQQSPLTRFQQKTTQFFNKTIILNNDPNKLVFQHSIKPFLNKVENLLQNGNVQTVNDPSWRRGIRAKILLNKMAAV